MFLSGFENTPLGRVWVPDTFEEDQIGTLPGLVCDRMGRDLFLDTLDGWVHHYREQEIPIEALEGFFKKIRRRVKRVFKKVASIPKKLHKATMKQLSKVNARRKKITKAVLKNKYGRMVVRGAGIFFSPVTGGLSLAAAEAASRYGKARYVRGLSRSSAFKRGAVGAVIGYVGGRAVSAGYSAVQKGGVAALNPFAAKAAPQIGSKVMMTTAKAAPTIAQAATNPGLWSKVAAGALKVGATVAPVLATTILQAKMAGPGGGTQYVDEYGYPVDQYPDYGSYVDPYAMESAYQNAYSGGGSTVVPDGIYDAEGNLIDEVPGLTKFAPMAIIAAGAIAGVVILKKRKRGK